MAIVPKVTVQSQRHPPHGHAHSHAAFPPNANPTVVSARVLAVALLLIALVSILGLGSMSFEPDPPSSRAACGGKHVGPGAMSHLLIMRDKNQVGLRFPTCFYMPSDDSLLLILLISNPLQCPSYNNSCFEHHVTYGRF